MNPFVLQPVEDKNAPNHNFGLKGGSSNSNFQNIPTESYFEDIIKIPRASPLQDLPSTMNILSPSVLPFSEKKKIFALHQHKSLAPTPAPTPNQAISKRNSDGISSPLSTSHRKPLAFKRVMSSPNVQHGGAGGGLFLSKDFGSDRSVRSDNNKENVLKELSAVETTSAPAEPFAPSNVLSTTPIRHKLPSERTGRTLESMRDRYDSARNTAGRLGVQGMFSEPPKRMQHGWTSGSNYASPRYTHLSGRRIFEESSRVSKYSGFGQQQPFFHESRSSAPPPLGEGGIFMRDLQTELNQLNRSREEETITTTEPKETTPDAVTTDDGTTAVSSPRGGDFCEVPTCPIIDEDDHNDESIADDNFLNSSCSIIEEDEDHNSVADVYRDKAATTRNNDNALNNLLVVIGDTGTPGSDSESSKALFMANPVVDSEYSESDVSRGSGDGSFSSPAMAPYPVGDSEYSSYVSRTSGSAGDSTYSSPPVAHAAVPSVISVKSSFSSAESECSKALHLANPIYESDYSYESSETSSQNDNVVQDFMGPFNVLNDSDDLMSRDLMSSRDLMPNALRDLMSQSHDSSQMMDSSQMLENEMCLIGTDLSVVFRTHEGALPSAVKNAADFDDEDSIRVYKREKQVVFNENVVQLCEDEKIETDDGPPIVLYDERAGGVLSKRCHCTIS